MQHFFKHFIFLYVLLFSSLLLADVTKITIDIDDVTKNESDGTMTFTIILSTAPLLPISIDYSTLDGSATAGEDYVYKSDYVLFGAGISSREITIDLTDDSIYEGNENFYIHLTANDSSYVSNYDGTGTIIDDELAPLILNTFNDKGITESDSDQTLSLVASFNRNLTNEITLTYHTEDGAASSGSDYIGVSTSINVPANSDSVTIPITIKGDLISEEIENFKVIIDSISEGTISDSEATATIYDNDNNLPKLILNGGDNIYRVSYKEGNNSIRVVNLNFRLDKPARTDSFFTYATQDNTAKLLDNDYVEINTTTYNIPAGSQDINLSISIIGDTKIENDEIFYFVFDNENNIVIPSHAIQVTILNDDGSYPNLTFDNDSFSTVEGNSSIQRDLNFTITLDAPALSGSSFDYYTEDSTAKVSDSDYVEINRTTYNIPEGVTQFSIPITIYGDDKIEDNERFYLKIDNEHNLTISGTQAPIGIINNDDIGEYPFSCNDEESFISFNQEEDKKDGVSFFDTISLSKGTIVKSDRIEEVNGVNSIGYNIKDNFIWGYNMNLNKVVRIDSQQNIKIFNISGLPERDYVSADVDKNGILYLFSRRSTQEKKTLERVDLNSLTYLTSITLNREINTADMAFNPKDNRLYFIQTNSSELYKITISSNTGAVELVGDIEIESRPIINFFDKDGNFYFNKDLTTIYKIDIANSSKAEFFSNLNMELESADGARCPNAPVTPPIPDDTPLTCDSTMYLSSSIKRGTGEIGKMWLHSINTTTNPFSFDVIEEDGDVKLYNALAYSDSGDVNTTNFIFGLYKDELLKIGKNGKAISQGKITALSPLLSNRQFYAGAAYNGYYYISGPGVQYDKIFKINLSNKSVIDINLTRAISLLDFSFTPDGKFLYGIIDGGELVKIDVLTGTVTTIGSAHSGYQFDSTFSDRNGRLFANDSGGKGFYEFNLQTGVKRFLSASQQASFNDGANCIDAELIFNDYGDAPESYGDARHKIANGIRLGANADHDITPYYSIGANGDDLNGTDDEDGVTLADGSELNGAYFELDKVHTLKVTLSKEAYLNIWIDKDINGIFDNSSDLVFSQNLTAGDHNISFNLPVGLQEGVQTYLRARVSSSSSMNPTDFVTDGEVEDYAIKFGTEGIKGTSFNIQRTNSALNAKDYNLYTQIVGRDFNYHIVAYDSNLTQEQNLTNVPLKIELFNAQNNNLLYTTYRYFSTLQSSRVAVLDNNDLKNIPATKEALFKISYATDAKGNIVQGSCGADYEACYNSFVGSNIEKTVDAQDSFAIRPETFYIAIADGNIERINSRTPDANLTMSAGYEYNLSIFATKFDINNLIYPSPDYNRTINGLFDFNSIGMTHWEDNSSISETINIEDGLYNNPTFTHDNVGVYTILIPSDTTWTSIDQATNDCILGSSITSETPEEKSGCNIAQQTQPISLKFYPDHFKIDLSLNNLPNSGHDDFIYMSELNSTYNETAIALQGKIIAQTEDNQTTTNFTVGCMATDVDLDLNASTLSVEGENQQIKTIEGTDVFFTRYIQFNDDVNDSNIVNNLISLGGTFTLTKNKFLDENNGTVILDIRYNINKNPTEPINPVQVTFNGMSGTSPDAKSTAYGIDDNYIPKGDIPFNAIRNFYYARVVSDLNNYPRVNMNISPIVRTPLNVDIYCSTTVSNYCDTTNVLAHTNLAGTTREQIGWYLSSNHNGDLDGNVTFLVPNPSGTVNINNDTNITLPNGSNGLIINTFNNCTNPTIEVTINTTPPLRFDPSAYTISCTNQDPSQWTGVGKTGNILSIKPKINKTGKMDW